MPFLVDMHRLGILTQVGAVYQFRHAELQEVLTAEFFAGIASNAPVDGNQGTAAR
jgi:hypothetical protein